MPVKPVEPLINPRDMAAFGRSNLIKTGLGSRNTPVITFAGPLSIKSVLAGQIDWRTRERLFRVSPDTFVLLNDGQEYALSTEAEGQCRTFCAFFEKGFVEQAVRDLVDGHDALLDWPQRDLSFGFFEQLTPISSASGQALTVLARAVAAKAPAATLDWLFHDLARALARAAVAHRLQPHRLPAARVATRNEIHRRLLRARAAMEDDLAARWTLRAMASAAAMAPFHFARCFAHCFGETPRRFLSRRRLERAHVLLKSGHFTVTEACLEVGYLSIGSFSAAYRAHHGEPPSHALGQAAAAGAGRGSLKAGDRRVRWK